MCAHVTGTELVYDGLTAGSHNTTALPAIMYHELYEIWMLLQGKWTVFIVVILFICTILWLLLLGGACSSPYTVSYWHFVI